MKNEHAEMLRAAIERETERVARLLDLLRQEHSALRIPAPEEMLTIAEEKQRLAEELEALGAQRQAAMGEAGVDVDSPDPLPEHLRDAGLDESWQRLAELLSACQEQNWRNGLLLRAGQQATQQALAVLLGTEQPGTYNEKGSTSQPSPPASRIFGKA